MNFDFKVEALTHDDVVNLLSCADYGCYYWCSGWDFNKELYRATKEKMLISKGTWNKDNICYEDVLAEMLINGAEIIFENAEDDETYSLTFEMIFRGIALAVKKDSISTDTSDWDANDADIVIQYSLFNEVVFG